MMLPASILMFRAMTTERDLLPEVLPAVDTMNPLFAREVRERLAVIHRAG